MINWQGFYSFEKLLKLSCKIVDPKLVVEWGPGFSTYLFQKFTIAEIYSWDNSANYAERCRKQFEDDKRIHIFEGKTNAPWGSCTPFVAAPLALFKPGEVDLVFIDGRFRADCSIVAFHLIKNDGLVVFHDIYRKAYQDAAKIFPFSFTDSPTGIYAKDAQIMEKVKNMVVSEPEAEVWRRYVDEQMVKKAK